MHPLGNNIFALLLSALYGAAVNFRNFLFDYFPMLSHSAGRPVISVGGIHAGGTGKTPMALLVGAYFEKTGKNVVFLSRGYHRKSRKTVICKPNSTVGWEDVGDEPALLHANLPGSWLGIGARRLETIRNMRTMLSDNSVFVLDDAFQHRQLRRSIDIVCLPADPFDDRLLPAGTLREPLQGLKRAHCICIIGSKEQAVLLDKTKQKIDALCKLSTNVVLYQVPAGWVHCASGTKVRELPFKKPLLLCGIARPERFIGLVKSLAVIPAKEAVFQDHHEFSLSQIQGLCTGAFDGILTTEKDAHRLHTLNLVNCPDIWYLKIDLQFSDTGSEKTFYSYLNGLIPV
jgi:tetraacyldisaccharide 4'-kinase